MEEAPNTHLRIDQSLCGEPVELEEGRAVVKLQTTEAMAVDDQGLVHGGFVFGAADYAAMLAVNEPNVVLAEAEATFSAPIRAGQTVLAAAEVEGKEGRKHRIESSATVGDKEVFRAAFTAFVLDDHVLE